MTKGELMERVRAAIDHHGAEIIELGEAIRRHPELGFKEFKTSKLVAQTFERMGLAPRTGLALTGVRADAAGRAGDGPTLALFGELDGLVVVGHPVADPETGAAHACGHNAQVASPTRRRWPPWWWSSWPTGRRWAGKWSRRRSHRSPARAT